QKYKKYGTAPISQRPCKLTPRQECLLMRRVEENLHPSSLQLSKEIESQTGVTISLDTIRCTLQRNGMHRCRPGKKPLLKPRHKKARLEFVKAHNGKKKKCYKMLLTCSFHAEKTWYCHKKSWRSYKVLDVQFLLWGVLIRHHPNLSKTEHFVL
uniref:Transposase Tc1-like domain-containing protein n=1 Tax=Echeneis naucrates TaxID=173247 RepID=A0A665VY73_ECHNA